MATKLNDLRFRVRQLRMAWRFRKVTLRCASCGWQGSFRKAADHDCKVTRAGTRRERRALRKGALYGASLWRKG